eukprot:1341309-Amphidinium_carterae.1
MCGGVCRNFVDQSLEVGELDEIVFEELLKVVHMVRAKEGFDADELQELTEVRKQKNIDHRHPWW